MKVEILILKTPKKEKNNFKQVGLVQDISYMQRPTPEPWGFIHTLEIIARILSEVVNRDRLCGTNTCCASFRNFWGRQTP